MFWVCSTSSTLAALQQTRTVQPWPHLHICRRKCHRRSSGRSEYSGVGLSLALDRQALPGGGGWRGRCGGGGPGSRGGLRVPGHLWRRGGAEPESSTTSDRSPWWPQFRLRRQARGLKVGINVRASKREKETCLREMKRCMEVKLPIHSPELSLNIR